MTSLEHYVTIMRAISLVGVPFGLPIISVPRTPSERLAPFREFRARARARETQWGTQGGNGRSRTDHRSSSPVHQRSLRYRSLFVDASRSNPGIPSDSSRGYAADSWVLLHKYYSRAITRTTATFDLPARRVRTSWVTRFRLFATWNEVSALSEAASRVRSDLNMIATCLRRRSRKVWGERNGHFEATMDRLRWRYSWRTNLRPTCVLPA